MLRVKIFSGVTQGGNSAHLEREINNWLDAEQPTIRQMTQSGHGYQFTLTFLYEKRRGEDEAHLAKADVPEAFERDMEDSELDPLEDEPTILPEAELPY
jgi:hypothetical protein